MHWHYQLETTRSLSNGVQAVVLLAWPSLPHTLRPENKRLFFSSNSAPPRPPPLALIPKAPKHLSKYLCIYIILLSYFPFPIDILSNNIYLNPFLFSPRHGLHSVPEHFGTVLANLVGPRNIRPLIEARRAYVKAHPRPELPPPPCQEQLLLDRQLMEMYTVLSQKR